MYLNCHSYFSFKYGTLSIEKLVANAMHFGVSKLALTDINNTSGIFSFVRECRKHHIDPVAGIDFRSGNRCEYIGLARNEEGFYQLNKHLTAHLRNNSRIINADELEHVFLIYPLANKPERPLKENEFIGIRPHETGKLFNSSLRHHLDKLVILQPVTIQNKDDFNLHRLLRAIDNNIVLSRLTSEQQALRNEYFVPTDQLLQCYALSPQIIKNTDWLLQQCVFSPDLNERKNKKYFCINRNEDRELLKSLAWEGLSQRYGKNNKEAASRLNKELEVIDNLDFNAYFLITHDIVQYAKKKNFFYVGRGSGANSIASYCLRITEVDPIELDLYFERFLNIYRSSPPDFDMDFSWKDRDNVIQYVLDKYGKERTALLANYNTFQGRSIIRELGKVFGLPKSEMDQLVHSRGSKGQYDHLARMIFQYGQQLENFPRHLSIHAGGILITERPVYYYTATEVPPKGFPISQFDMHVAEDIKMDKLDILSQRGLGHIKSAMELIKHNRNITVDINHFDQFKQDPTLNKSLEAGKTLGCFYIESPAMRQLLVKLRCNDYPTLVAASSIIRPGVASSGMMRTYIKYHLAPETVDYIHPKMEELLKETHGVMVYQEDVIKIAHHFGSISMAEADVLRKGMSGKGRSREQIMKIKDKFFKNCKTKNYPDDITAEVWRQIESFAGYSFSKAHSASFAVESYLSLYLRYYYPYEFMVAVINNFGGFYQTEFYVHEAKMLGAKVHAPCINHSNYLTTLYDDQIYLGFVHLKNLEKKVGELIEKERKQSGKFRHLEDFLRRVPIGLEQATLLIRIGAFRFTGKTKKDLLWEADMLLINKSVKAREGFLFEEFRENYHLPVLSTRPYEDAFDEIEILGFPLCSPFELLDDPLEGTIHSEQMKACKGKKVTMTGYLITTKDVRTINDKRMHFGTFLDYKGKYFDSIHFPASAAKYPFLGAGFYRMKGKIVEDFEFPSIEVDEMKKLPLVKDPRYFG